MRSCHRSCKTEYFLPTVLCAAIGCVLAAALSILLGSARLSVSELFSETGRQILLYVRLPRTLSTLAAGAALAVSGAIVQGVLSNRLASPSLIGVNSGAGLAVTVCTALGIYSGWRMTLASFLGAFLASVLLSAVAQRMGASKGTLILAGVALNSFLGAISSAIVTLDPNVGVMSNDFKVGDFSAASMQKFLPSAVVILLALVTVAVLSNQLDVISLGDESALSLGLNVRLTRGILLLLASALAGASVCLAGLLSFVGLIVPHAVRALVGNRSSRLIPVCALVGAGFVTVCDLVCRTLFAPHEIPVGIVMAFIGAPFFVFLLIRGRRRADA